jgi:hypothetical protein
MHCDKVWHKFIFYLNYNSNLNLKLKKYLYINKKKDNFSNIINLSHRENISYLR